MTRRRAGCWCRSTAARGTPTRRAELEDVAETIDPRLAEVEEDVDTLGGLAFVLAGHVPQAGECLTHASGWKLEIIEADPRRVTRLRLHPPEPLAVEEE